MVVACGPKVPASQEKVPCSTSKCLSKPGSSRSLKKRIYKMATPKYLECNICGKQQPYERFVPAICKHCDSQWLEARYDYEAFKREILRGLPGRPLTNMWRYQDVLPLDNPAALDLYPAGGTPLWLSQRYAPKLGHANVYIKDERYGPTSSFKDRQAAGA